VSTIIISYFVTGHHVIRICIFALHTNETTQIIAELHPLKQ